MSQMTYFLSLLALLFTLCGSAAGQTPDPFPDPPLDPPVAPEPSSLLLLGVGMASLLLRRTPAHG